MMRAQARPSMTAPVKLVRSSGLPTVTPSATPSSTSARTAGHSDAGTYRRAVAEHFWPEYSKAPRTVAATAERRRRPSGAQPREACRR